MDHKALWRWLRELNVPYVDLLQWQEHVDVVRASLDAVAPSPAQEAGQALLLIMFNVRISKINKPCCTESVQTCLNSA